MNINMNDFSNPDVDAVAMILELISQLTQSDRERLLSALNPNNHEHR
jgi:hypothetical protein